MAFRDRLGAFIHEPLIVIKHLPVWFQWNTKVMPAGVRGPIHLGGYPVGRLQSSVSRVLVRQQFSNQSIVFIRSEFKWLPIRIAVEAIIQMPAFEKLIHCIKRRNVFWDKDIPDQ